MWKIGYWKHNNPEPIKPVKTTTAERNRSRSSMKWGDGKIEAFWALYEGNIGNRVRRTRVSTPPALNWQEFFHKREEIICRLAVVEAGVKKEYVLTRPCGNAPRGFDANKRDRDDRWIQVGLQRARYKIKTRSIVDLLRVLGFLFPHWINPRPAFPP